MILKDQIEPRIKYFENMCREHHVKYLYAFGSSVTDQFDMNSSDIDLLVEVDEKDPVKRGENLISLWDLFESFFHRKVDLLTEISIRNPYLRESINSTKILIYDGTRQEVLI
jgi:hypothetical protein